MLSGVLSGKFGIRSRLVKSTNSVLEKNPILRPENYIGIKIFMNGVLFFFNSQISLPLIPAYTHASLHSFIPIRAHNKK